MDDLYSIILSKSERAKLINNVINIPYCDLLNVIDVIVNYERFKGGVYIAIIPSNNKYMLIIENFSIDYLFQIVDIKERFINYVTNRLPDINKLAKSNDITLVEYNTISVGYHMIRLEFIVHKPYDLNKLYFTMKGIVDINELRDHEVLDRNTLAISSVNIKYKGRCNYEVSADIILLDKIDKYHNIIYV